MALKQANRSATVAFAPMAQVMAAGTMAGAIDLSFSSSACLELFSIDLASDSSELELLGNVPVSDRFNRLSWGKFGSESTQYPYGILAGGLVDGSVNLWDPSKLMSSNPDEWSSSVVKKLRAHQGSVRGLEFNSHSPNLLASGAEDGEIKIWNIDNPEEPSQFAPLKSGGGGEISCLSWNPKVAHILASTSFSGNSVVWDLRKQKQIISFTDPVSHRRCSAIQWNPDVATQLIVASDEDRSPSLQVWDLRNSISPVRELTSHTKGVLAMAWCPHDSGLLLTCGKDNRTLCWDTTIGEVLYELPAGTNWNFDLQWSPRSRGLLSTSSFDGQISLYSIESAGRVAFAQDDFSALTNQTALGLSRAPQWLKRPCGVSFGFGGRLVSFGQKKSGESQVKVDVLVTEEELLARSAAFEASVSSGEKATLKAFCEAKATALQEKEEQETWQFLGILFDDSARTKLLNHLEYFRPEPIPAEEEAEQIPGADAVAEDIAAKLSVGEPAAPPAQLKLANGDPLQDEDFFDNLQGPVTPKIVQLGSEVGQRPQGSRATDVIQEGVTEEEDGEEEGEVEEEEEEEEEVDPELDEAIERALVVGNYEGAVDSCLAAGRMADALVIASVGGSQLWSRTQSAYIKAVKRPYMRMVECIVSSDLVALISHRPLEQWRETLAMLCTYAESNQWGSLCSTLADKLEASGDVASASLCFICAGDIERAVKIWIQARDSASHSLLAMQDVLEKSVILSLASQGERAVSGALSELVADYAEALTSQGKLTTAMDYLAMLPEDATPRVALLRDRIYHSGQVRLASGPPPFPFAADPVPDFPLPQSAAPAFPEAHVPTPHYTPVPAYPSAPAIPHQPAHPAGLQQHSAAPVHAPWAPPSSSSAGPAPPAPPSSVMHPTAAAVPAAPAVAPTLAPAMFVPQAPVPSGPPPLPLPPASVPQRPPSSQPSFQPKPSQSAAPSRHMPGPRGPPPGHPPPSLPSFVPVSVPAPSQPPSVPTALPAVRTKPQQMPAQFIATAGPTGPAQPTGPPVPVAKPSTDSSSLAQGRLPSAPAASASASQALSVATADTSRVAGELAPVVAALRQLYEETAERLGGPRAPMVKRREMEDNSKKLGGLFARLNIGDVSPGVAGKLQQLAQALTASDYDAAMKIQVGLTASDWDECGAWLVALKRMIRSRQAAR